MHSIEWDGVPLGGMISYIAYAQLLYYLMWTWWLILAVAASLLALFVVGGVGVLLHMR